MTKITGLVVIIIQIISIKAVAQKPVVLIDNEPGWRKIGEAIVNSNKQNESIWIRGDNQFTAIKLKVNEGLLTIDRIQVFYESGEMKGFDVKNNIGSNTETCEFDLNPKKKVNKVAFTYQTSPNDKGGKANVVLYGFVSEENEAGTVYRNVQKVADKVSETSETSGADLVHERHKTKEGPNAQTIYIEKTPVRYYYVDRQGQKVYVKESQLKNKKDN